MEKNKPSYTVGSNANWCSHYGKKYGGSLRKLKIELPYDSASPFLGIYPGTVIWKDIYIFMFIAALFRIANTEKQPEYPSVDIWIKNMWYIYAMEYYSTIKKSEIMPLVAIWWTQKLLY